MAFVSECWLLGRLATPVGTLLVVSDTTQRLRALDWTDHEARLHRLLRLQYRQGVALQNAVVPSAKIRCATVIVGAAQKIVSQPMYSGCLTSLYRLGVRNTGAR